MIWQRKCAVCRGKKQLSLRPQLSFQHKVKHYQHTILMINNCLTKTSSKNQDVYRFLLIITDSRTKFHLTHTLVKLCTHTLCYWNHKHVDTLAHFTVKPPTHCTHPSNRRHKTVKTLHTQTHFTKNQQRYLNTGEFALFLQHSCSRTPHQRLLVFMQRGTVHQTSFMEKNCLLPTVKTSNRQKSASFTPS